MVVEMAVEEAVEEGPVPVVTVAMVPLLLQVEQALSDALTAVEVAAVAAVELQAQALMEIPAMLTAAVVQAVQLMAAEQAARAAAQPLVYWAQELRAGLVLHLAVVAVPETAAVAAMAVLVVTVHQEVAA